MRGFGSMLFMQVTHTPQPLPHDLNLSGQTALITGGNGGLGFETAKDLADRSISRLIIGSRSLHNEQQVREEIQRVSPNCRVEVWQVDYEDYQSMLSFSQRAAALDRLDIVLLNAGLRHIDFKLAKAGHEQNLQVNHIGTALLSLLLYPVLAKTAEEKKRPTKLTIVTSVMHRWTPFYEYKSPSILARMDQEESMKIGAVHDRYATTKLFNILWVRELASKVDPKLVVVNTVDPGLCQSSLRRHDQRLIIKIVSSFAEWKTVHGGYNIAHAAVVEDASSHGKYVSSQQVIKDPSDFAMSSEGEDAQKRIWKETIALLHKDVPNLELPDFV